MIEEKKLYFYARSRFLKSCLQTFYKKIKTFLAIKKKGRSRKQNIFPVHQPAGFLVTGMDLIHEILHPDLKLINGRAFKECAHLGSNTSQRYSHYELFGKIFSVKFRVISFPFLNRLQGLTSGLLLFLVLVSVHSAPAPLLDGGISAGTALGAGILGSLAVPAGVGGAAGAAFTIPTGILIFIKNQRKKLFFLGLALGGAGVVTIPTYMLLLKAALLKKAALLGGGGIALSVGAGNRNNYRRPRPSYY